LLKPILIGAVVGIAVIFVAYVIDIAVTTIQNANTAMAEALSTTPSTKYINTANDAVGAVSWVVLLAVVGVFLVYAIHVRRR